MILNLHAARTQEGKMLADPKPRRRNHRPARKSCYAHAAPLVFTIVLMRFGSACARRNRDATLLPGGDTSEQYLLAAMLGYPRRETVSGTLA